MVRQLVQKYPVIKTMGAYLCLNSAADISEQFLIKKRSLEQYDGSKTVRMGVTGCFVIGPLLYNWVHFLHRRVPGKTLFSVVKKVAIDTVFFAPVAITTFYLTTNILEFKADLMAEWRQKFLQTWKPSPVFKKKRSSGPTLLQTFPETPELTSVFYWPAVQTINFAFVPLQYKTSVYMPVASFIWMNYMCYMKDKRMTRTSEKHVSIASEVANVSATSASQESAKSFKSEESFTGSKLSNDGLHSAVKGNTDASQRATSGEVENVNSKDDGKSSTSKSTAGNKDGDTETSSKGKLENGGVQPVGVSQDAVLNDKVVEGKANTDELDKCMKVKAMKVACESVPDKEKEG